VPRGVLRVLLEIADRLEGSLTVPEEAVFYELAFFLRQHIVSRCIVVVVFRRDGSLQGACPALEPQRTPRFAKRRTCSCIPLCPSCTSRFIVAPSASARTPRADEQPWGSWSAGRGTRTPMPRGGRF